MPDGADIRSIEQPHSIEAEQAVLGTILLENDALSKVGFLEPFHFFDPVHARLFQISLDMNADGRVVSPVSLRPTCVAEGFLSEIGGTEYLIRLVEAVVAQSIVKDYAKQLVELYARRRVVDVSREAMKIVSEARESGDAIEHIDTSLDELRGQMQIQRRVVTIAEAATSAAEQMLEEMDAPRGIPTGLADLDAAMGGVRPSLTVIGGRPSMGKTAIAVSMARRIAQRGYGVIFVSLEMQGEELAHRMVSERLREKRINIPYFNMIRGAVSETDARQWLEEARGLEELNISIVDMSVRRLSQIQTEVRREVRRMRGQGVEVGGIFIDHMGLIEVPGIVNDTARMTLVSSRMQGMFAEHKCPVIALSQLNRQVEAREDKRPRLSDLRESGSIEQDATNVLFCFRPEYYTERARPPEDDIEATVVWEDKINRDLGKFYLQLAKQRNGPVREIEMHCDLSTNSFWDVPNG